MAQTEKAPLISDEAAQIYTWVSLCIVCQAVNICGIITNVINIICFVKQGFEDSVNISLLGLAASDLGSLSTFALTCVCMTPSLATLDLPFDPLEVGYMTSGMLHFAFTRISACITAMITVERCLCITNPLKIKDIITPKRTAVITICVFLIFTFSGSPVYAVNSLGMKYSELRNKTLYGLVSTSNRGNVEKICFAINNFVIPFSTFVIIVVCTLILALKLQQSAKWRKDTLTGTQGDRVSSRNQKTAKMVVMISVLFIVCFIPVNSFMLALGLVPSLSVNGKDMNISVVIMSLGFIMESLNSAVNIFIYYRMSSKYKETLRKLLLFPDLE